MNQRIIALILFFIGIPVSVLANAGSPLIWFGAFHLLILNAIIGLIESSVIGWFELSHSKLAIIGANYFSMIVGLYFIMPHFSSDEHSQHRILIFTGGMILSYLATLIIEFPIFFLALKEKKDFKILLKPFIIANTITNAFMIIIYLAIIAD